MAPVILTAKESAMYDQGWTLDKMANRLMENGHPEDEARRYVETYSVVSKFAFDEPVTRWFFDIQLDLFEKRSQRRCDQMTEELRAILQKVEVLMVALAVDPKSPPVEASSNEE